MNRLQQQPLHWAPDAFPAAIGSSSAETCAKVLDVARRLIAAGVTGSIVERLVARAEELLDDYDDVLIELHPQSNPAEFATGAALHRELEHVQSALRDSPDSGARDKR